MLNLRYSLSIDREIRSENIMRISKLPPTISTMFREWTRFEIVTALLNQPYDFYGSPFVNIDIERGDANDRVDVSPSEQMSLHRQSYCRVSMPQQACYVKLQQSQTWPVTRSVTLKFYIPLLYVLYIYAIQKRDVMVNYLLIYYKMYKLIFFFTYLFNQLQ